MTPPPTSSVVPEPEPEPEPEADNASSRPSAAATAAPAQFSFRSCGTIRSVLMASRSDAVTPDNAFGVHSAYSRSCVATASRAVSVPKLLACAVCSVQSSDDSPENVGTYATHNCTPCSA